MCVVKEPVLDKIYIFFLEKNPKNITKNSIRNFINREEVKRRRFNIKIDNLF